jgi:hypothetical protein
MLRVLLACLVIKSIRPADAEPNDAQMQWAARVLSAKLKAQAAASAAREKAARDLSPQLQHDRERAKQAAAAARAEFVRRRQPLKP